LSTNKYELTTSRKVCKSQELITHFRRIQMLE
jgi:hypothetical protein